MRRSGRCRRPAVGGEGDRRRALARADAAGGRDRATRAGEDRHRLCERWDRDLGRGLGDDRAAVGEMIDINLTGVFNTVRAALPSMVQRGEGGAWS